MFYIVTQLGHSTSNVVPSSLKKMYMSLVIAPSLTVTYFTRNGVVLLPRARYWTSWVMKCFGHLFIFSNLLFCASLIFKRCSKVNFFP